MSVAIVTLDEDSRRDGTCQICLASRTVFAVKYENGAWTWACRGCSDGAQVMK